ncbi:YchF/TatD family DNA exonuclease [Ketobacter sp. MCCC 1A13808]|uniref:TatD family hydrolase n=1 Tax=Ketobacter sp. MCCC 1A13808 TaxID=2602738 RepID=UPI0012EBBAEB|nr:TatD family hydrolase [Ketobacter sp. MCCC 1A13808]MVF14431.1 YchF/TatD family DNA exonuclease [Ketobacter sp. MCCC 1A13808]
MISPLTDIGVNLTDKSFAEDLEQVIESAVASGVTTLLITGTNLLESQQAVQLCRRFPDVTFSTAGVHPHHAKEWTPQHAAQLTSLAADCKVVAIGETGLDYNRNFSAPEQQRKAFESQLELAAELKMPLFLHERDAHDDQLSMLKNVMSQLAGGVIHCFTGTQAELEHYLDLGLYIGITGWICDERRGMHLRELVKMIPADRLLLETDCPYLLPRTLKPKPKSRRNEPKYLPHITGFIAGLLSTDSEALARQTTLNARRLFNFEHR